MGYEIAQGPFLLMETVAMLHKYVNGLSFQSAMGRREGRHRRHRQRYVRF